MAPPGSLQQTIETARDLSQYDISSKQLLTINYMEHLTA